MGLKGQAVKGVAWTSVGTLGYGGLNLLVTIVLARLLTPYDFGLIELLVVFSGISDIIVDSGFSQAVIKDNSATGKDLSSVFWLNVTIGLVIYTLLFFAAPFIARFYDAPVLMNLSRIVFLTVVFNSFSVIQNANFSRNLNFKPYSIACICGIIISGSIAILLAQLGFGVWALAINLACFSFVRMAVLWILSSWYPSFTFGFSSVKKYFRFGVNLLVQGLLDKIVTNLESLIIGKIYTKQQLGYFSQGRKLDSYVTQAASSVVIKVSYPLLAKVQDESEKLKEGYRSVVGVTMSCITPIMAIMFCGASYIMNGVFGGQWLPAAPYLKLWSLCGWCLVLYSIFINVFLVRGRSRLLLSCSIVKQVLRVSVILFLVRRGIMPMMIGIVVVTYITGIIYIIFGGKLIGYSLLDCFKDLAGIVLSIVIASFVSISITPLITTNEGLYGLIILSSLLIVTYLICMFVQKNKYLSILMSIVRRNEKA